MVLLVSGLFLTAGAQNSKRVQQMKAQRTELKKQIEQSESLLHHTKKDVASQLNHLALLDAQIVEKQRYIDRLKYDSDSLNRSVRHMQRQIDTLQRDLMRCKANYRKAMTFVSHARIKQSRWMFVLMAKDFRDLYRRMRYAAQYSKYQRAQGEVIRQKEIRLREKQQAVKAAKKEKEHLLGEAKVERETLGKKKEDRKQVVAELNKKQKSIQSVIQRDRKKYRDINIKIDKLIKEEIAAAERRRKAEAERRRKAEAERRRKAEAERRRQEAANRRGGKTTASHSGKTERTATPDFQAADDADSQLSNNFASNRGRLPVPITGAYAVTSRYGTYNVEGLRGVQLDNKGIDITAKRGAQARSIFDGEVVTVANFGGSYTIIIRHGDYYSVYNNLASVSVRRGQKVKTAQIIGNVAADGNGNCKLHFQLRRGAGTLNPQSWIRR